MARRTAADGDGFDFLLDAMTNAFGGILFLTIVISLQLQERTYEERSADEASNRRLEIQSQINSNDT